MGFHMAFRHLHLDLHVTGRAGGRWQHSAWWLEAHIPEVGILNACSHDSPWLRLRQCADRAQRGRD